ncbi:MAG TPA: 4'-phosphopantetheinyl transferase superfamily protein [Spirochaetales bacterium]|nr:4'-phosphopantetheinyl transferase superfamily protein [Spirochaetales bacterium]HRZ64881.1 4'-phosphopantetheinyl transferase superfamily protein [Spirochaetia bacterium]
MSRLLLRGALAQAASVDPGKLAIVPGPFGKPRLEDSDIRFNLSHAPGCVILALSRRGEVGCDIEDARSLGLGYRDIAPSCLQECEMEYLAAAPDPRVGRDRFLAMFVEKEARLKALGAGLAVPPAGIRSAMKEPPFREATLACFRSGEGGSRVIAVCLPSGLEALELIACRYEGGRISPLEGRCYE